jgi:2-keto-4-pentenoate hydratase/2-oxohepta-3-ene-1,7-dioic acid hydratase in catechol pathway
MVYTCADIVQYANIGTVETGDVITTGTPEGVSALSDGDTVEAAIESVGSMSVDVTERDVSFGDVDVEKSGQN